MPLAALGLSLGADAIDALFGATPVEGGGTSVTESLGGGGSKTNAYEASLLAQEQMQKKIPGLMGQLNYNAAGQSGEAARQGFQNALGNLTNSAQAVNDASAMRQDADSLRNMGSTQGQLAMRSGQQTGARAISAMVEGMRNSRNPAMAAAAANNLSQGLGQNNTQMMQQSMAQGSQNLAQAGQMQGSSNNILQSDLQNRNDIFVKPFYNSMQDLGSAMGNITGAGTAASNNMSTSKTTSMQTDTRALGETTQSILGSAAQQLTDVGVYRGLFDPSKSQRDGEAELFRKWKLSLEKPGVKVDANGNPIN